MSQSTYPKPDKNETEEEKSITKTEANSYQINITRDRKYTIWFPKNINGLKVEESKELSSYYNDTNSIWKTDPRFKGNKLDLLNLESDLFSWSGISLIK